MTTEVYVDHHERVFVLRDGRGPFTVLEPDGTVGQTYIARGAIPVRDDVEAYQVGFDEGHAEGCKDTAVAAAKLRDQDEAERRRLAFLVALRSRPLSRRVPP